MARPVDLDDQSPTIPPDVQVDPATWPPHDNLASGLGQPTLPAQRCEVQLPEGLGAVCDVADELSDERSTVAAGHQVSGFDEPGTGREPLLHGHDEHQSRLPIAHCPVGGPDGGDVRAGARDARGEHLIREPAADRMVSHAGGRAAMVPVDGRDVNVIVVVARQPGRLQSRDAVEHRDWLRYLPDRPPPPGLLTEVGGVQRNGLPAVHCPPAGSHLVADPVTADADSTQERPRCHAVMGVADLGRVGPGQPCAVCSHGSDDAYLERPTPRGIRRLWTAGQMSWLCGRLGGGIRTRQDASPYLHPATSAATSAAQLGAELLGTGAGPQDPGHRRPVAHEGPERRRHVDAVVRAGHHPYAVPAPDRTRRHDRQVGTRARPCGEPLDPVRLSHPCRERLTRDPGTGHLEDDLVTDCPPFAEHSIIDVHPFDREVLPEQAVRQVAPELAAPPVELLARHGIHRLPVPAVVSDVADEVADDPASEPTVLGPGIADLQRLHGPFADAGRNPLAALDGLGRPHVDRAHQEHVGHPTAASTVRATGYVRPVTETNPTPVAARPSTPIDAVADGFFDAVVARSPMTATYLGMPGVHDGLDDFSLEGLAEDSRIRRATLAALDGLEPVDDVDRVTLSVLRERLGLAEEIHAAGLEEMSLNVISSPLQDIRAVFDLMPTDTAEDWATIARRMARVPAALAQYLDGLSYAAEQGRVAARRQVVECAEQCRELVADDGYFAQLVAGAKAGDDDLPETVRADLAAAVEAARAAYAED